MKDPPVSLNHKISAIQPLGIPDAEPTRARHPAAGLWRCQLVGLEGDRHLMSSLCTSDALESWRHLWREYPDISQDEERCKWPPHRWAWAFRGIWFPEQRPEALLRNSRMSCLSCLSYDLQASVWDWPWDVSVLMQAEVPKSGTALSGVRCLKSLRTRPQRRDFLEEKRQTRSFPSNSIIISIFYPFSIVHAIHSSLFSQGQSYLVTTVFFKFIGYRRMLVRPRCFQFPPKFRCFCLYKTYAWRFKSSLFSICSSIPQQSKPLPYTPFCHAFLSLPLRFHSPVCIHPGSRLCHFYYFWQHLWQRQRKS